MNKIKNDLVFVVKGGEKRRQRNIRREKKVLLSEVKLFL